ncbi:hypothetical protein B0T10DRAFT_51315 [Thelonectria olida]|uniref:Uncharacterized protein n=1 Tax=Thelonectria olida TaxID=1576542 RepID=A0A9P8W3H0_9HYPO|nr:hypothetical protein B0T10DRAFT_51315 [Thelonectria olida]
MSLEENLKITDDKDLNRGREDIHNVSMISLSSLSLSVHVSAGLLLPLSYPETHIGKPKTVAAGHDQRLHSCFFSSFISLLFAANLSRDSRLWLDHEATRARLHDVDAPLVPQSIGQHGREGLRDCGILSVVAAHEDPEGFQHSHMSKRVAEAGRGSTVPSVGAVTPALHQTRRSAPFISRSFLFPLPDSLSFLFISAPCPFSIGSELQAGWTEFAALLADRWHGTRGNTTDPTRLLWKNGSQTKS